MSDPTGLYHMGVHWRYTYHSALESGFSIEAANQLADRTRNVDLQPGSQEPEQAARHGMCPPNTPLEKCFEQMESHVERSLKSCTPEGLADAIHAVQDRGAGGHQAKRWPGMWKFILTTNPIVSVQHFIQDLGPFSRYSAAGVALTNRTKDVIREYQERCSCK